MDLDQKIDAIGTPGLASLDAQCFHYHADDHNGVELKVVVPEPTMDDLEYYDFDEGVDLKDPDAVAEAIDAFKETSEFCEWAENYRQQMTAVWPVSYLDKSMRDIAEMLNEMNVAVAIAEIPECLEGELDDYEALIVMTGGGTDLSNDLAQAYLCCGQVPPAALMDGMGTSMMDRFENEKMKALMGVAMRRAADHMRSRAERFEEIADRYFPEVSNAPGM